MSKGAQRAAAREKLRQERQRREKRERQLRLLGVTAGMIGAAAAVLAVVVIVDNSGDVDYEAYSGRVAPVTRQADGTIAMAQPGVQKPVLEVFEDFQCPFCKKFEGSAGKTIKKLAAEGKIKVVYRPFSPFTRRSDPVRGNSARAANAALCAPADKWLAYGDKLFENQPSESKTGFKAGDLVRWGQEAGITDPAFATCVNSQQKAGQFAQLNQAAKNAGIDGTPSVKLDGRKLEQKQLTADGIEKAVNGAK